MEQDNGQRSAKRQHFSIHDPACDSCRSKKIKCGREKPRCVNCRRNCVSCRFSSRPAGRSKLGSIRVSGKENGDHAAADERLLRIEQSLVLLSGALGFPGDDTTTPSQIKGALEQRPPAAFGVVPVTNGIVAAFADGSTQFYGLCSLITQCFETKQLFASTDEGTTSANAVGLLSKTFPLPARSSYSTIERLHNKLIEDHFNHQWPSTGTSDLPSRDLLEQCRAIYFSRLNRQRPILQESSFRDHIHTLYSQTKLPPCHATIVCFRYVIVQVLRLQRGQDIRSSNSPSQQESTWVENTEELRKAARAVVKSPSSLKPQLIDVQALTVAAFTALDDGCSEDFQSALTEACKLAKYIGLHQEMSTSRKTPDREERLWVFWNLYILDKTNLLSAGRICLLSSFDCGAPFPEASTCSAGLGHESFLARIRLANIHEEIYQGLYSVEARRRDSQERTRSIGHLHTRLRAWRSQHNVTLRPPDNRLKIYFDEVTIWAELSFAYHNCSVLIHHTDSSPDARRWMLEDARKCLSIVEDCDTRFGTCANFAMLCSVFYKCLQEYPFVPYFALFSNLAQSQMSNDGRHDAQLLQRISSFIAEHERRWSRESSPSHLCLVSSTLLGLARAQDRGTNDMMPDPSISQHVSGVPPSTLSHIQSPNPSASFTQSLLPQLQRPQPQNHPYGHQSTNHSYISSSANMGESMLYPTPPQTSASVPVATFTQDDEIDSLVLDEFDWHQAGHSRRYSLTTRRENSIHAIESPLFTGNPELEATGVFGLPVTEDESSVSQFNGFNVGESEEFDTWR